MFDLFETPIKSKKVRNGVFAHSYKNGTINIDGQKYVGYSMTEAIKKFRQKFPARNWSFIRQSNCPFISKKQKQTLKI